MTPASRLNIGCPAEEGRYASYLYQQKKGVGLKIFGLTDGVISESSLPFILADQHR